MSNLAPSALLAGDFRKSSFSTTGSDDNCVYIADRSDMPIVEIRDSKRGLDTPGFPVGRGAFRAFITGVSAESPSAH
jgi:hypothetical protein